MSEILLPEALMRSAFAIAIAIIVAALIRGLLNK